MKICHERYLNASTTIIPLPFQYKLNYFSFFQTFEKLFIIFAEILTNLKVQLLGFEP
jgi:hypothetical protein